MRVLSILLVILVSALPVIAQPCPPSANWCSGTYQYDGMGNIRAIGNDTYIYDTAGRLVSGTADVQRTGVMSRQDYGYDAFGNRISASRAPGSVDCLGGCEQSLTIDPATNHITSNGAVYDAAGNLIFIQNTVNGTSYSATYTYDGVGSLTRATAGSDDRQFIYTADDERIAVKNGQSWTWTVRDLDGKVLREFTSLEQNGLPTAHRQWAKDYIWRDGLLLATVAPTTPGASTTVTQHFHLDHLGTPRLITNANGVQLGIHSYYPFGAELNLSPNEQPGEMIKFTGHERDLLASNPNTLDYMHARYYNGYGGRFLSVDSGPADPDQPQSWNRYAYVMNNPVRRTDPTGRCTEFVICNNYGRGAFEYQEEITVSAPTSPQEGTWAAAVENAAIGMAHATAIQDKFLSVAANGIYPDNNEILVAMPFAGKLMTSATAVSNTVPSSLARVIPGELTPATLGRAGATDVFVTAAGDIQGLTAEQLGPRLGIPASDAYTVIQFPTPSAGIASPIMRNIPGFIGRGLTSGGAREFVVPNGPIPWGGIIRVVAKEGIP
jgi:RHS repeat-associated protein